jgi:hypothetical protein
MDEPDSMKVPPASWQLLQNAWRPAAPRAERRDVRARREQAREQALEQALEQAREAPPPTPLATLAFGIAGQSPRPH